jgi:uncharacterized protein YceH (UPF0502 family)
VGINLTLYEARVIGCLIEKEITTPDQYPLSPNALTNACNQKSNREPVLELDEVTVQQTVDGLVKKHLVSENIGFGSRVTKYRHRFCNTEFGTLKFSDQELGIICELLLRGPQTPGELRTRANRLRRFSDMHEVEATLKRLMERDDGPFVVRLSREIGKRESRYAHLFCGAIQTQAIPGNKDTAAGPSSPDDDRLDQLEKRVSKLCQELDELKRKVERLTPKAASGSTEA